MIRRWLRALGSYVFVWRVRVRFGLWSLVLLSAMLEFHLTCSVSGGSIKVLPCLTIEHLLVLISGTLGG